MTAWRVRAVLLPMGDVMEAGITAAGGWTLAPPMDAEPLPGRFVLPGLVDAHCHLALERNGRGEVVGLGVEAAAANLVAARAAGVTTVRDTGGPGSVTLRLMAGRDEGELLVCGRFLAPEGQYYPGLYEPVPAEDLVAAALAEVAAGARWVKLVGDFPVSAGSRATTGSGGADIPDRRGSASGRRRARRRCEGRCAQHDGPCEVVDRRGDRFG
jgi:hypothetical protein